MRKLRVMKKKESKLTKAFRSRTIADDSTFFIFF